MARNRSPEPTLIEEPDAREKNEVELEDEVDEALPITYSITSYGADYPVDGLVKRIENGDIYVPPFQRGYTWVLSKASRFIESLLLGLPVPGIFLAAEANTRKLLVIDGQQRLRTLQYFYKGVIAERSQAFSLTGTKSSFDGSTYERLSPEDRRRLDDSIMHATIVRQDQPSDDDSSIYEIFSRLNTGADLLQPQEIRFIRDFRDAFDRIQTRRPAELVRRLQANVALCCSCADRRSSEPPKDAWTPPKGISGGLNAAWESAQVSQSSSRNSRKNRKLGPACTTGPSTICFTD